MHHLFAASRSAGRVRQIEKDNELAPFGPFWDEILHNSLAIAALTVASLEGFANELYFENSALVLSLNPAATEIIAAMIDKEKILTKYDLVLALLSGKRMPCDRCVVQNVHALIKLRNSALHFRPEFLSAQDKHDKLSRQLVHKFELSRFVSPHEPLFPRAWASGSFAVWALKSTVDFLDYFYHEVKVTSPVERIRADLSDYAGADI